ncbi:hypothetical protein P5P86_02820 [Nocardioides sp. BP30]|uniref:hypothetical protein n=1 Tax=Nocardioides sp. BP30 TaxID=3036374 RepID=UPI002468C02E|nr:hypothetical protein [Nocardioides sp. BP30]WGL52765.1 hypothetical protein P5P86_02820 [Nocardioides sp. BP30]
MSGLLPEGGDGIAELYPPSGGSSATGHARRSQVPALWLDAGPLAEWAPAQQRMPRRHAVRPQAFRFVLTEVVDPRRSEAVQQWIEQQQLLVVRPETAQWPCDTVFWRLAVNQRAVALGALPCPNAEIAVGRIRRLVRRVSHLGVSLAFFPDQPAPRWVVHDHEVPVMIGLPHQQLVAVDDPECSLAATLSRATMQSYVHRTGESFG